VNVAEPEPEAATLKSEQLQLHEATPKADDSSPPSSVVSFNLEESKERDSLKNQAKLLSFDPVVKFQHIKSEATSEVCSSVDDLSSQSQSSSYTGSATTSEESSGSSSEESVRTCSMKVLLQKVTALADDLKTEQEPASSTPQTDVRRPFPVTSTTAKAKPFAEVASTSKSESAYWDPQGDADESSDESSYSSSASNSSNSRESVESAEAHPIGLLMQKITGSLAEAMTTTGSLNAVSSLTKQPQGRMYESADASTRMPSSSRGSFSTQQASTTGTMTPQSSVAKAVPKSGGPKAAPKAAPSLKSKFRSNLLGGLHDGSLERVVAEAEALEEPEQQAQPQAAPKAGSPLKNKFRNNLLGGLHDGSLERVVAEAEALEEPSVPTVVVVQAPPESTAPASSAPKAGPERLAPPKGSTKPAAPKEEEKVAASLANTDLKSKFRSNLLGGLRDGNLERVVAEAEALEEEPQPVQAAPKVAASPAHSDLKSKFRSNLLGGLRDGNLERVVAEAEALEEEPEPVQAKDTPRLPTSPSPPTPSSPLTPPSPKSPVSPGTPGTSTLILHSL